MPLTWIVSVTVAMTSAYRARHDIRGGFLGRRAPQLQVGLTAVRVEAIEKRLTAEQACGGTNELDQLGPELGSGHVAATVRMQELGTGTDATAPLQPLSAD